MEGFDEAAIFYSDNYNLDGSDHIVKSEMQKFQDKCEDFIVNYHTETFAYTYRDTIKLNYGAQQYFIDINLQDLAGFDMKVADSVIRKPGEYLPYVPQYNPNIAEGVLNSVLNASGKKALEAQFFWEGEGSLTAIGVWNTTQIFKFEVAATIAADKLNETRAENEKMKHVQVMLNSHAKALPLRELKSLFISQIVKIQGIVVAATGLRTKATTITLQCRTCGFTLSKIKLKPGLEGYTLPRRCSSEQAGQTKCPLDPYMIRTDNCSSVDFQTLKLQELPESVPQGEMPRHVLLYSDRFLCERVVPGNRVNVVGVYSIKKRKTFKKGGAPSDKNIGVRTPYIRVIGISVDNGGCGNATSSTFTPEEEEFFTRLSASPNIYDRIFKSIAPSIFGFDDVKKAIAALLFGGSRKRLPDGLCRRGDINILLLGDPGTAKSQLLKFVDRVSPIGVYTSGKGSSAAGLTASIVRDPHSRNFIMEGGAMVLADGGVVCIDEFDKMREDDRVAIHEAMEQQTISIAKAGITTSLNSRCSVLAAANSVFGRWDELKGAANIDFMPTILSRFDMIFIIKDDSSEQRDITIAKHIMDVHTKADEVATQTQPEGELSLQDLKGYINFCRKRCAPRLSEDAGDKLKTKYVLMRSGAHKHEMESTKSLHIPITVRQLEAIIRIAESLAKMELKPIATETHINEALRLFQVSTLDAAFSGALAGSDEFTSTGDFEKLLQLEKQLKKRFPITFQVSEQTLINDFTKQKYPEHCIRKVIQTMLARGELVYRAQRKLLLRLR